MAPAKWQLTVTAASLCPLVALLLMLLLSWLPLSLRLRRLSLWSLQPAGPGPSFNDALVPPPVDPMGERSLLCMVQKGRVQRQVPDRQGCSGLAPWVEKNSICWEPVFPCGAAACPQLGPHKEQAHSSKGSHGP